MDKLFSDFPWNYSSHLLIKIFSTLQSVQPLTCLPYINTNQLIFLAYHSKIITEYICVQFDQIAGRTDIAINTHKNHMHAHTHTHTHTSVISIALAITFSKSIIDYLILKACVKFV
jgi:hypothetical protein